jgi:hypothetical protein
MTAGACQIRTMQEHQPRRATGDVSVEASIPTVLVHRREAPFDDTDGRR